MENPIEFRPGESTDKVLAEIAEAEKLERERKKDFTNADHFVDSFLLKKLERTNPYSSVCKINPDGKFDLMSTILPTMQIDTPEELYKAAAEIEKKSPEYHFNFETDPEGKWIKYTVSKK